MLCLFSWVGKSQWQQGWGSRAQWTEYRMAEVKKRLKQLCWLLLWLRRPGGPYSVGAQRHISSATRAPSYQRHSKVSLHSFSIYCNSPHSPWPCSALIPDLRRPPLSLLCKMAAIYRGQRNRCRQKRRVKSSFGVWHWRSFLPVFILTHSEGRRRWLP